MLRAQLVEHFTLGMLPRGQWFNPTPALSRRKNFLNCLSVNVEAGQIYACTQVHGSTRATLRGALGLPCFSKGPP